MRFSLVPILALSLPSLAAASLFDWGDAAGSGAQVPLRGHKHKPHHPAPPPHAPHKADPFGLFVGHFDQHRYSTDIYLQTRLTESYPNHTLIVTQDPRFQLLAFGNSAGRDDIIVRRDESIETIARIYFAPALRRRDGSGHLIQGEVFAGYRVAWGDDELLVVHATWAEGYSTITQWHLLVDKGKDRAAYSLIQACMDWSTSIREAVLVFDQGYWRPDFQLFQAIQKASWDDVVLEEKFKKSIQNDYRSFFKSEDTYKRLGVPWKRGLIFLGPPGNGKTISLKAIMKEVKVPILYVKSLHTYMGDEFGVRQIFERARAEAPCVLIMEDLDSLINNQNRAFFLNEVDGLEDNDGLLLIGSTNHFDRLDPALSSRPSRFDRKYNFPNPNRSERRDYALYWQHKLADKDEIEFPDDLLDTFADKTDKFSFAYMKEAFVASLLTIAGQEGDDKVDFPALLIEQVDKLREQIGEEEVRAQSSDGTGQGVGDFGGVGGGGGGGMGMDVRGMSFGDLPPEEMGMGQWKMGVRLDVEGF